MSSGTLPKHRRVQIKGKCDDNNGLHTVEVMPHHQIHYPTVTFFVETGNVNDDGSPELEWVHSAALDGTMWVIASETGVEFSAIDNAGSSFVKIVEPEDATVTTPSYEREMFFGGFKVMGVNFAMHVIDLHFVLTIDSYER